MGLGDIFEGAAGAVGDVAGGLVHGAGAVISHLDDAAQVAGWVANPTHWDNIAAGVGNAAQFVGENPGQVWDVGFEVGRHIVKEEILDPQNLAINLGLTAATVFTGGGSGAALAARVGGGALRAAKGIDTAVTGSRVTRAAAAAGRTLRSVDEAAGATRAFNKGVDVLGYVPEKIRQARSAIPGMSEYGIRGTLAGKIAPEAAINAGEVGLMRGAVADVVRGAATRPGVRAGTSAGSQRFADLAYASNRTEMYASAPEAAQSASRVGEQVYQIEKDPYGYAMRHGGRAVMEKAGQFAAQRAGKSMLDREEKETPTYVQPDAYSPPPDVPDITTSGGYTSPSVGGFAPDASESIYTSSAVGPISVGRGQSFYEGAGMVNPYEVTRYA